MIKGITGYHPGNDLVNQGFLIGRETTEERMCYKIFCGLERVVRNWVFALFRFNNKGVVETMRAHTQSKQKEVIFHLTV